MLIFSFCYTMAHQNRINLIKEGEKDNCLSKYKKKYYKPFHFTRQNEQDRQKIPK